MPTPNKWVYAVLLLFMLFLIWSDPAGAGATARTFVNWLGAIVVSIFDFLDGLLGPETPTNQPAPVIQQQPPTPGTAPPVVGDQFNPNPQVN